MQATPRDKRSDFLKAVYVTTEKMEKPIVIVDSWDAVTSYTGYYEQREREELEHNLCDFSRKKIQQG